MSNDLVIRRATCNDYEVIAEVMYEAVRFGRSAYTEVQRQAWVPKPRSGADWTARLDSQAIFVAVQFGAIDGFMSLAENGYIDFAYVRPRAQGTGLFRRLFEAVKNLANQTGQMRLWLHASLTAEPAFTAIGFTACRTETVEIGGQSFDRFEMEMQIQT